MRNLTKTKGLVRSEKINLQGYLLELICMISNELVQKLRLLDKKSFNN